jgi:FkbM family methyltransferase
MKQELRKLLLTIQSDYPTVAGFKERVYATTRRCLHVPHEREFKVLALIPSSLEGCYVDIGGNKGQSIQSILLFKPTAKIVCFEPNLLLAQKLKTRYRTQANVRVIEKGLSNAVGGLSLFVPSYKHMAYDELASLDRESAANWITHDRVFGFDPAKLRVSEVHCEVSTLDCYGLSPVFIKIDVQGTEYNVLAGAQETLRRCEPVLIIEDYRGNANTVRLLEGLGYEEFFLDGIRLKKGRTQGDNSLLLTPSRVRDLRI